MTTYLSVLCLITMFTVVKSAKLYITPGTNIQAGTPKVTVKCQPSDLAFTTSITVNQIDLFRLVRGVSTKESLGIIKAGKQAELGPGLTSPKYTVSGSITSDVSTTFLQIVIKDPNSKDTGNYGCNVTGITNGGATYKGSNTQYVQVSGGEGVINSGSVVFLLSASFINLILY